MWARTTSSDSRMIMLAIKRGFSIADAKRLSYGISLFAFFLLIALGNTLRFLPFSRHHEHLLITELFLFSSCFVSLFFIRIDRNSILFLIGATFLIFFSFLQGVFIQGFEIVPFMYCFRLIATLTVGIVLGHIFSEKYQGDLWGLLSWLLKGYMVAAALSYAMFLIFPNSKELWEVLEQYGIKFVGDPHVKRFVSVYFDPNYYAAIACLPFLISTAMYFYKKNFRYLLSGVFFFLTICLTNSRSGIATFLISAFFVALIYCNPKVILKVRSYRYFFLVLFVCLATFFILFSEKIFSIVGTRVASIASGDESAGARWWSFLTGVKLIQEHPFFGVGYNYIRPFHIIIDSSMIFFMTCFGVIPFLGMLVLCAAFLFQLYSKFKRQIQCVAVKKFAYTFLIYVVSVIVFCSFFNNVVFYTFWLVPAIILLVFMRKYNSKVGC